MSGLVRLSMAVLSSVPAPLQPAFLRVAMALSRPAGRRAVGGSVAALCALVWWVAQQRRAARRAALSAEERAAHSAKKAERKKRQSAFGRDLRFLLRIVLPGVTSKEALLLGLHTLFLFSRTFISIAVASLDGQLVKAIVDRDGKHFLWSLAGWLGVALPATYANAMIKFLESKLQIAFRTRLVDYAYTQYMRKETYYRVGNLDSRLANADQCLTEDISRFSDMLAHLYSQISKPILDVVVMSVQLIRLATEKYGGSSTAGVPTLVAASAIWLTTTVLRLVRPPFGRMVAKQAELEGELRFVHSRLITNAEEVAFYRGHEIEETALRSAYTALAKQMNTLFRSRIVYNTVEGYLMKYFWSATGLCMIAIPPFLYESHAELNTSDANEISNRASMYTTSKKLLVSASEAIERLMLAIKEISELQGYAGRVATMLRVFDDVENDRFVKNAATELPEGWGPNAGRVIELPASRRRIPGREPASSGAAASAEEEPLEVKFEGVPIVSPNCDVLVRSMSFTVAEGTNLLITGPNGCGKSSLFRILGGIWPPYAGTVQRPAASDMFYIPQRPYLVLGTLRDQLVYPHTVAQARAAGVTDDDLMQILRDAHLEPIFHREGGWDAVRDWKDVLSGGEKQRVGMARVFYHLPKFAILDECTSAVSIDVEGRMYQRAIDLGVTLLTVTHRPSLWKFHSHLLKFDGEGGYELSELNADSMLSLKDEKSRLEEQLTDLPKDIARLKELSRLLGEDSAVLADANLTSSLMRTLSTDHLAPSSSGGEEDVPASGQ